MGMGYHSLLDDVTGVRAVPTARFFEELEEAEARYLLDGLGGSFLYYTEMFYGIGYAPRTRSDIAEQEGVSVGSVCVVLDTALGIMKKTWEERL